MRGGKDRWRYERNERIAGKEEGGKMRSEVEEDVAGQIRGSYHYLV